VSTEVTLPRLGQGMETGTIVRWVKREGDEVRRGDPLYELDTDKVTQEVEAEVDGVLLRILVAEGEVEVGTAVAVIGSDGENGAGAERPPEPGTTGTPEDGASSAPAGEATQVSPPVELSGAVPARAKASPLARRIARERGIDLTTVQGTGPDGRILAADVEEARPAAASVALAAPASPVASSEVEVVQLSNIRKTIARRLTEAWTAPVFQLGVSVEMSEALALREALVERTAEGDVRPTVNDLLVKLAAVALVRHPPINATFTGEEIQRHPAADVGIAVAAPQGLVVPVVRGAERLTVQEIARARADLVGRARDNKLTLADLEGGTFTISNLGMFGVESFTAVLNPPQVAILAVGAVADEAVVVDGVIDIAPIMRMTLTCDHRAIDGADGAQFFQTLVTLLEQPALAL
jgi:pyruvate dehydrogenase E2 component (dihydrolipoamide acetyltransferase)